MERDEDLLQRGQTGLRQDRPTGKQESETKASKRHKEPAGELPTTAEPRTPYGGAVSTATGARNGLPRSANRSAHPESYAACQQGKFEAGEPTKGEIGGV